MPCLRLHCVFLCASGKAWGCLAYVFTVHPYAPVARHGDALPTFSLCIPMRQRLFPCGIQAWPVNGPWSQLIVVHINPRKVDLVNQVGMFI